MISENSQSQKKIFQNNYKKRKINSKKLKEREQSKREKRKIKQQFFLPENLASDGYKRAEKLKQFLNKYGKIEGRKINKLKSKKYRKISKSIKKLRILGFIPFLKK